MVCICLKQVDTNFCVSLLNKKQSLCEKVLMFEKISPLLHRSLYPDRKLKKLVRELKDKGVAELEREEEKPPQQWNLDYALAPFEGLTPEYMEMSESVHMWNSLVRH